MGDHESQKWKSEDTPTGRRRQIGGSCQAGREGAEGRGEVEVGCLLKNRFVLPGCGLIAKRRLVEHTWWIFTAGACLERKKQQRPEPRTVPWMWTAVASRLLCEMWPTTHHKMQARWCPHTPIILSFFMSYTILQVHFTVSATF